MNDKSVLRNDQLQLQINVGVAKHSFVGTTVYGATLRKHPCKKVKPGVVENQGKAAIPTDRKRHETKWKDGWSRGLCLKFYYNIKYLCMLRWDEIYRMVKSYLTLGARLSKALFNSNSMA